MKICIRAHDLGVKGTESILNRIQNLGIDGVQMVCYKAYDDIPYTPGGITLENLSMPGGMCLLAVGLIHTGLAYCMYFSSLKDLPGQKVAILSYIDPLVAVLLSWVFLHEPLTGWQIAGGLLILGSTLWNEISEQK